MIIIFHASCADGFTAAWLASKKYGLPSDSVKYIAANYGEEPPDVANEEVLILDFSYPRNIMINMKNAARWIKVLDHHKTAQQNCEGLDFCTFDMSRSGAQLTEDWLLYEHPISVLERRSLLVAYVGDRDLWNWAMPNSKEINAAIASYEFDFDTWDVLNARLLSTEHPVFISEGEAILRYQDRVVRSAVKKAGTTTIGGHVVPCMNATQLISEIGEQLCKGHPFSATWFENVKGERIYSLRSNRETGIDVSEIVKQIPGGGGHKNAAGFTLPKPGTTEILKALARGYCSEKNKDKVLDSDLVYAMVEEVRKLLS